MNERESLIRAIDDLIRSDKPGASWHAQAKTVLRSVRTYLAENRSVREVGRKGGAAAKEVMGVEGYAKIGRKGGLKTKKLLGSDHYREIGRRGGEHAVAKKD